MLQALKLLGDEDFVLINADVWTDFPLTQLTQPLPENDLARLVMVDSAEKSGDFALDTKNRLHPLDTPNTTPLTFSGISLLSPNLFNGFSLSYLPLRTVLEKAIDNKQVGGIYYTGEWVDVGNPERLKKLNQQP